eukprot:4783123-Pyramimonas_sp.AAC.1
MDTVASKDGHRSVRRWIRITKQSAQPAITNTGPVVKKRRSVGDKAISILFLYLSVGGNGRVQGSPPGPGYPGRVGRKRREDDGQHSGQLSDHGASQLAQSSARGSQGLQPNRTGAVASHLL